MFRFLLFRFMLLMLVGGLATAQNTANLPSPTTGSWTGVAPSPTVNSAVPAENSTISDQSPNSPRQSDKARSEREGRDDLLDLPPLPDKQRVSEIGGRVLSVDRVLDRMEIQPFGGKRTEIDFDVRTQMSRDGAKITPKDIRPGDRIYADTQLDNSRRVFAKSIRVVTKLRESENSHGQIVYYDAADGTLTLSDELIPEPIRVHLTRDTVIRKDKGPGSINDLQAGSLVAVQFNPGGERFVQQITLLAIPGTTFVFAGPITHLDLSSHLLAVSNVSDSKTYDVDIDPARGLIGKDVREGSDVTVRATFDGKRYVAQSVSVNSHPSPSNP